MQYQIQIQATIYNNLNTSTYYNFDGKLNNFIYDKILLRKIKNIDFIHTYAQKKKPPQIRPHNQLSVQLHNRGRYILYMIYYKINLPLALF